MSTVKIVLRHFHRHCPKAVRCGLVGEGLGLFGTASQRNEIRLRQGDPSSVAEQGPMGRASSRHVRGLAAPGVNLAT
jgi:hypothetical protein